MKNTAALICITSKNSCPSRKEAESGFEFMRDELSRYVWCVILKSAVRAPTPFLAANDNDREGPRPPAGASATAIRRNLAEDPHFRATVLNQVHVELLRAVDRGAIKGEFFRQTLFVIAQRVTWRMVRVAARHELRVVRSSASREIEVDDLFASGARDPEQAMAAAEEVRVMGHLFATLNDDEQCLLRAVAEGEAYEDLAPRFRATVSALKTRVSRLRGQLRERRDATL